jgi:hypothetical protein
LNIEESASLKQAERALKHIKVKYHPDKHLSATSEQQEQNQRTVSLAEEAFLRIKQREAVSKLVSPLITPVSDPLGALFGRKLNSENYTLHKVDGKLNRRQMTQEESAERRPIKLSRPNEDRSNWQNT